MCQLLLAGLKFGDLKKNLPNRQVKNLVRVPRYMVCALKPTHGGRVMRLVSAIQQHVYECRQI